VHCPWDTPVAGIINLPAVIIILLISCLLMIGISESARVNAIIVVIKVAIVIIVISIGWGLIHPENYVPFIPDNTGNFGEYGWSGIFRAAAVIFFAYIGFDAVSTAAQEAKRPQRDMPIGIIGSLAICTVLYILFAHVLTGMVHYTKFKGDAAPVATVISLFPTWLQSGIVIGIIAGYSSVILVMLLGQSRVFFSMSRDGLLPKVFSDIHPRFQTPWRCNLIFMLFVSLFSGFLPISKLGHMTSIGTLLAFVIVCIGVMIMRKTNPDAPRPYRTPLVPVVPILGVLVCFAMMASLDYETWIRLVVWLAIGLTIYFTYGIKKSHLRTPPRR
jgi:APA family basic amino acid/polyamine antiporter